MVNLSAMRVKDRISGLPLDILAHILGLLRIREAAISAILCTSLRDAWLSLPHLNFDSHFFIYLRSRHMEALTTLIIKTIIIKHKGPIRKFEFDFYMIRCMNKMSTWLDFDEMLHRLTRKGVEEIHLSICSCTQYVLPDCIFSCLTLQTLHLSGVLFPQIRAPCIFPNVTSLFLENVKFDQTKCSHVELPMLRNLTCESISGFDFTAPMLRSLKFCVRRYSNIAGTNSCLILPVKFDLGTLRYLHIGNIGLGRFVEELSRIGQAQTTLNVEHLKLRLNDKYSDNISTFLHLLRMCPMLIKLDIHLTFGARFTSEEDLLMVPEHTLAQTFDTIRDLSIVCWFHGSSPKMTFFKWLLCRFPALEKVLFFSNYMDSDDNPSEDIETLMCFLRAHKEVDITYYIK
ncbi:unnamed protein product [Cuscuta epithymum]|uniref:F-box/LRR-repeat protein 15/At3g58940/PEG3-like LRR domain-containing protein n=1 Tax=Cuscuta epithymum TaxID=186058 RepID=A0AAV0ETJ4_9ASTE|nr:unnamed protein product [Cuscuta epithymum]